MKIAYYLAQSFKNTTSKGFLSFINRIGTVTIALGMACILLTFMVFKGFKDSIQDKLFAFSGHLSIIQYSTVKGYFNAPIYKNQNLCKYLQTLPEVEYIQAYSFKNAILQSPEGFLGILLKGIDRESPPFIKDAIEEGQFFELKTQKYNTDLVISDKIAKRLNLKLGQTVKTFFMDKKPRMRQLKITGIYRTYIEEYDKIFAFVDNRLITHLNNWVIV